ncbi:MAG: type II toxin-antitoxin system VapC family toxin [Chloroflexota bacterium]
MADAIEWLYWDADAFVSYIEKVPGRIDILDALLKDSASSDSPLQIVTSTISVAEVAYIASERRGLDPAVEAAIDALWADRDAVKFIDYHHGLGLEARSMIREAVSTGITGLRAADAIHLASAKSIAAREVHTYSADWPRFATMIGCPIRPPYVRQPMLPAHLLPKEPPSK